MLRGIGISRKALEVAVHNRDVRRVLRGVYVRVDAPDTIESRVAAARLVTSEHSVICDRTAAWIHGIDVFAWHETEVLPADRELRVAPPPPRRVETAWRAAVVTCSSAT